MKFVYCDGGRSKYFKATNVGDCVTRAIANATGKDYKEVYDALNKLAKSERTGKRKKSTSSSRDGVYKETFKKYLEQIGWVWHPTMKIGSGCTVHLDESELPNGVLIVSVSKHLTCVKNGVIYDTYDCSREGNRCVYGYWTPPQRDDELKEIAREILLRSLAVAYYSVENEDIADEETDKVYKYINQYGAKMAKAIGAEYYTL